MAGLIAGALARPALALGGMALGAALAFAGGFGAGEAFEHRGPAHGLAAALGQSLKTQRDAALVRVGALQRDVAAAQAATDAWETRARAGDTARDAERRSDVAAAQGLSTACEARIAQARASADAIARLVARAPASVPMPASGRCPARETISSAELDQALGR